MVKRASRRVNYISRNVKKTKFVGSDELETQHLELACPVQRRPGICTMDGQAALLHEAQAPSTTGSQGSAHRWEHQRPSSSRRCRMGALAPAQGPLWPDQLCQRAWHDYHLDPRSSDRVGAFGEAVGQVLFETASDIRKRLVGGRCPQLSVVATGNVDTVIGAVTTDWSASRATMKTSEPSAVLWLSR